MSEKIGGHNLVKSAEIIPFEKEEEVLKRRFEALRVATTQSREKEEEYALKKLKKAA